MNKKSNVVRFYPKDIKRFIIIALGLAGYFLILSVINDFALVRIRSGLKNSEILYSVIETLFIGFLLAPLLAVINGSDLRDIFDIRLLLVQLSAKVELLIGTFIIAYAFSDSSPYLIPFIYFVLYVIGKAFRISEIQTVKTKDVTTVRLLAIGGSSFFSQLSNLALIAFFFATQDPFAALLGSTLITIYLTFSKKILLKRRYKIVINYVFWGLLIYLYYSAFV